MRSSRIVILMMLLAFIVTPSAFTYHVVLVNGGVLSCAHPPACEDQLCLIRTTDGDLISERISRIDFKATDEMNDAKAQIKMLSRAFSSQPARLYTNRDLEQIDAAFWFGKSARMYTNVDLAAIPLQSEVTVHSRVIPSGKHYAEERKSKQYGYETITDAHGRDQRYWRNRMDAMERQIERAQAKVDLHRQEYTENSRAYLFGRWIGAEPVPPGQIPTFGILEVPKTSRERVYWFHRVEQSRRKLAQSEMDLKLLEQDRRRLMNNARRDGALPGWLTQH
ncbi:hypothetical protein ACFLU6_01965 [Acidobacteriota bacterium]